MAQTAVEWLIKEFNLEEYKATTMFAKEKENQQTIDAYMKGQALGFDDNPNYMAEQYYNETYGSEQQTKQGK